MPSSDGSCPNRCLRRTRRWRAVSRSPDERGSGFKNIHVSSFGYNVLENEDGTVVTTDEYQNNPGAYPNVKDRPLTVHIENIYNDAGEVISKRYLAECILPKQFFKNKHQSRPCTLSKFVYPVYR